MKVSQLVGAVLAVAVGVTVYSLWPKQRLSPEDEIRRLVANAVASAERRDAAGVVAVLDDGFQGQGASSKHDLHQLLVGQFFRARQVAVVNPLLEVTVSSPSEGHFKGTFLIARDSAVPDGTKYDIEADVRRFDDGWRITAASWTR